jgi:energy-coupling factor transporter ATP-binding protein EcfA2
VNPAKTAIESRLETIRTVNYFSPDRPSAASVLDTPQDFPNLDQEPQEASSEEAAPERERHVHGPEHRPRSTAELGIRRAAVDDLALKTLYVCGALSTRDLARHLHVSTAVADELVHWMRTEQLCQVTGMVGNVPTIALTGQARSRALELLSHCQYTGAVPVSLASYVAQVRKQSVRKVVVRKPEVERAFHNLVIDSRILGQIGTALNSGSTIFVHGPAGVGKTAIAETMSRVLSEDQVWVPHAIEVDGQIIALYDSVIHKEVEGSATETQDPRWVRCRRPSVLVGGELTIDMLDLQFNANARYYSGPIQMKANNGVLIVDDFGRQRVRPEELLNRWVVPLDRGIDFLTLVGGRKIEVPFEMLVVFATNMDPSDLVDAAFLRRMQTKIQVNAATEDQFCSIFRRVAHERGLRVDDAVVRELAQAIRSMGQELRGCQPRDLVNQVCWAARYEDRTPVLDQASLGRAAEAYFLLEKGAGNAAAADPH